MERREPREEVKEVIGIANIYASYNNTIVHITDIFGNTIARAGGGQITKYDRLEASPTVAMFVAKKVAQEALEKGITAVHVRIRSVGGHSGIVTPGPGAQASVRSLAKSGLRIKSIADVTPLPHGGCRPPHGRRGRRV
ncbi:MAG: 30S ribosomal protein S11 [Nanoarchaeota archaeon]